MAEPRPARPAILVGYGAFGLGILRQLLASTAPRGILSWETPRGGAAPSERSLQDLALLWVPDRTGFSGQAVDDEDAREGSSFEMMRDLYRQIQQVEERDSPEADFAAAVAVASEKLLSATARAGRRDALPLGLDVIVLARPTVPEVIGSLDRLLARGMEQLANNANLSRGIQSAEALNFVAILDFENYWDRREPGRRIREALHNSVEQWRKRQLVGSPAFGRIYLVDGRTADGIRDDRHRMDEIALFVELLLFEGQRSGELQRLYQPQARKESPVGTFGVRLMERSAGLLSRLAAARFGIGWLTYLAGSEASRPDVEPTAIRRCLAPYRPAELTQLLDRETFAANIAAELAALENDLLALPLSNAEWPQLVRDRYRQTAQKLEASLTAAVRTAMGDLARGAMADLAEGLRAAVEADLHHPRDPVPLGAVLAEIDAALAELAVTVEPVGPPPGAADDLLARIDELHARYLRFNHERLDLDGLRRWWWLQATAVAAGLTPPLTDLLADVPPPDRMRYVLNKAYDLLRWLDNPLAVGLALFAVVWWFGAGPLQRRIAARMERARRFYSHPDRGRFVARLREGLGEGGGLRAPIDHTLDRLLLDLTLSVRGEISRELARIGVRLRERRREMLWLREQLRQFLRLHGLDERPLDAGQLLREGSGIRHTVERGADFDRMLKSNPPNVERFRSAQASSQPFAGWQEPYCAIFLQPLAFLDRLSTLYQDPFLQELVVPGTGPEQLKQAEEFLDFLARQGSWPLAFEWKAQEGVPPDRRYCLLPRLWHGLPDVLPALADRSIPADLVLDGTDSARAYLLCVQTGVAPACLLE